MEAFNMKTISTLIMEKTRDAKRYNFKEFLACVLRLFPNTPVMNSIWCHELQDDTMLYLSDELLARFGYVGEVRNQKMNILRLAASHGIPYLETNSLEFIKMDERQFVGVPAAGAVHHLVKHIFFDLANIRQLSMLVNTTKCRELRTEIVNSMRLVCAFKEYVAACLSAENDRLVCASEQLQAKLDTANQNLCVSDALATDLRTREAHIPRDGHKINELTLVDLGCHSGRVCKVIRGQRCHSSRAMKKIKTFFPSARVLLTITEHPNAVSKWLDLKEHTKPVVLVTPNGHSVNAVRCNWPYETHDLAELVAIAHPNADVVRCSSEGVGGERRDIRNWFGAPPAPVPAPLADHTYC